MSHLTRQQAQDLIATAAHRGMTDVEMLAAFESTDERAFLLREIKRARLAAQKSPVARRLIREGKL